MAVSLVVGTNTLASRLGPLLLFVQVQISPLLRVVLRLVPCSLGGVASQELFGVALGS